MLLLVEPGDYENPHAAELRFVARGHTVTTIDPAYLTFHSHPEPTAMLRNAPIEPDVVILKSFYPEAFTAAHYFAHLNIPVMNSPVSAFTAYQKHLTATALQQSHVPTPPTIAAHKNVDSYMIETMFGFPVVVKPATGSHGLGATLAHTVEELAATLLAANEPCVIQPFISESAGTDIRAWVIGGKAVAWMKRTAQPGEWRSNLAIGGTATPFTPPPEYVHVAEQAAQALRLNFAGVDILETCNGPVVVEVNANPGYKIIDVTGIDVLELLVEYVEKTL